MAISSGPVTVGQPCASPATTQGLWETIANLSSSAMTVADEHTPMYASMSFRATDNGSLYTGNQILANPMLNGSGVITIPGSGTSALLPAAGSGYTGSISVKRPTCTCTQLTSFAGYAKFTGTGFPMRYLKFDDGYEVELGKKICLLVVRTDGVGFKKVNTVSVGDTVIKCAYPGPGQQQVQSSCTTVVAASNKTRFGQFITGVQTTWPQNEFPSSEVIGSLMLENGVYVNFIPNGGSY